MDQRYFHGIRTAAAATLTKSARADMNWVGLFHLEKVFQELFCYANSPMTRPNDFSDRTSYLIQCAIPRAIAKIRDDSGKTTLAVRTFLLEKLKFNDNSSNEVSVGSQDPIDLHPLRPASSPIAITSPRL